VLKRWRKRAGASARKSAALVKLNVPEASARSTKVERTRWRSKPSLKVCAPPSSVSAS
jgi:hypothetical protein